MAVECARARRERTLPSSIVLMFFTLVISSCSFSAAVLFSCGHARVSDF
jgi:hypothetical protein